MDMSRVVAEMKKEFGEKIDTALAAEAKRKLSKEDLQAIAKELPEVITPKLSKAEEKKAMELKADLDGKVEKMAELTAALCRVAADYNKQAGELHGLLMGKDTGFKVNHSGSRLNYMLRILSRILENDLNNAVAGFRSLPDQDYIHGKISNYNGI